jgi:hypothetical protein
MKNWLPMVDGFVLFIATAPTRYSPTTGYTNREIALALGVAEGHVASRFATAKDRLSVELARTPRPSEPSRWCEGPACSVSMDVKESFDRWLDNNLNSHLDRVIELG